VGRDFEKIKENSHTATAQPPKMNFEMEKAMFKKVVIRIVIVMHQGGVNWN
jgi:hypothetical protein